MDTTEICLFAESQAVLASEWQTESIRVNQSVIEIEQSTLAFTFFFGRLGS